MKAGEGSGPAAATPAGPASPRPERIDLAMLRRFFALAPFMVDLGVEAVSADDGRVATRMAIAPRLLQHTGVCHAGAMATLVDHTMGAAAQMAAPPGHWAMTAELKTSLLRPAVGDWLECSGWVLKAGRSLSFTEGEVWACRDGGARALVMKASATMALAARPPQPGSGAALAAREAAGA